MDRFGPVPHEADELMHVVGLRRVGKKLGCEKIILKQGYLLPEYYSEAYIAAPYTVNFTVTDWLGMLKNVDFPAEDTRVPILQIIKTCLQYTELPFARLRTILTNSAI